MKIVIDIPEELYNRISEPTYDEDLLRYIIRKGTPLEDYCESCIYKPTESEDD